MNRAFEYAAAVEAGQIPSCIHIKNAVKRFRQDQQRTDIELKEEKVQIVIDFFRALRHSTGDHAGKPFELEGWQVFIITNIYGWFYTGTRTRRFNNVYIEVARKNGKTALSAGLALYHLIADGEAAAEVLLTANSKEQASIAYKMTRKFTKNLDPESKLLKHFRSDILFDATDSMLKVLAADADKLDGYNCSFGLVDEYHSAPTPKVRDVIRSSQGMRKNPLLVTITTAGFDKSLPCYELRTVCTEIAAGMKEDDNTFCMIYSPDDGDGWKDKANWYKSNPNLGVTIQESFLQKQVTQALNSPSDETGVRTKNFNEWLDTSTQWLPDDKLLEATEEVALEDLAGKDVCIGVDLASNQDLTAVAFLYYEAGTYFVKVLYYLPAESLNSRKDKELYKDWQRHKHLTTTSGNVTDYDFITADIMKVNEQANIVKVYYDKYNSTQWAIKATEEYLPIEPYSQTVANFNAPTRELERLILSGKMIIDNNPVTRFCFRNVELKLDHNGNCKPNKGLDRKKIDGTIAIIQALAVHLENSNQIEANIF